MLSYMLEFVVFSVLYYGQLTIISGHYPETNQSEHIYRNRYGVTLTVDIFLKNNYRIVASFY